MADLEAAITRIETSRQTHIEWRDYWLKLPDCRDCELCKETASIAGDLEHQIRVIAEYNNVLAVLYEMKEVTYD
jgi:hypothetical protein